MLHGLRKLFRKMAGYQGYAMSPGDMAAHRIRLAQNYDAELDGLQLAPNGDDYNALVAILADGRPRLPHTTGR